MCRCFGESLSMFKLLSLKTTPESATLIVYTLKVKRKCKQVYMPKVFQCLAFQLILPNLKYMQANNFLFI